MKLKDLGEQEQVTAFFFLFEDVKKVQFQVKKSMANFKHYFLPI